MTRTNNLYLIIGALILVVAGLGFYVYREETKPEGVQISIGENGIKVEEN
ncbi:hypothetical protein QTA58_01050 [Neorhizobium sp. CSC1952]|jgi:hypothetical protein|uniref:Uncharacterized protein n=1 Tax=Xaviernesmea oryzae TaxID=464029 RepID=A0A1X7FES2_9HYPH|nr:MULTISPECIES: hypothetical protein [Rhizobium/Agrobacterium group]WJR67390.1 hypothetical protein QTA58_01050 [Rhizobium sp. CSC1952]SMF50892.1 hypothetical protein SAMN02982989_2871 [Xaviernesmea oryzae]